MDMQSNTFEKGDWIVHAHHGVGQIRDMEKKELDGATKKFFRVRTFNSVYWLSAARTRAEYIRQIASEYQIKRALQLIRKSPKKLPEVHTERKKLINDAVKDASLYTKACMIRDLNGKGQESKLNFTEEDALIKMKKQFVDEWSVIKDVDRAILEDKLDKVLNVSSQKIY